MPTYLLHGFRWPRPLIRIHIILQNLDDAAAEWLCSPLTTKTLLANFDELFPESIPHLPNLRFVEQYDPNDLSAASLSQPYAYVADVCEEVKLGVDVDEIRGRGVGNEQWGALMEIRDRLAPDEKVGWWVVVCGDEERWAPPAKDLSRGGFAVNPTQSITRECYPQETSPLQSQNQYQHQQQSENQYQRQPQSQNQYQRQPQPQNQYQRQSQPQNQYQHQEQPRDQYQHQQQPQPQQQRQQQQTSQQYSQQQYQQQYLQQQRNMQQQYGNGNNDGRGKRPIVSSPRMTHGNENANGNGMTRDESDLKDLREQLGYRTESDASELSSGAATRSTTNAGGTPGSRGNDGSGTSPATQRTSTNTDPPSPKMNGVRRWLSKRRSQKSMRELAKAQSRDQAPPLPTSSPAIGNTPSPAAGYTSRFPAR